jgi:UDP-2-acetamido-3-amino-2,3-dideoxy-glucuronate N-acetyltransferase
LVQAQVFIPNGVRIGNDAFIGPQVCFTNDRELEDDFTVSYTYIGAGAKIGANSTIIAGVIIGPGAVIGAGSVVTKSVPEGEVWVGNPASYLREVR